jgi:hypothetical protein
MLKVQDGSWSRSIRLAAVTSIGTLSNNFNPESLFTLNNTTAVANIAFALGNGNDGEAIAFNPMTVVLSSIRQR